MISHHSLDIKQNNLLYGPGKRAVLFTQGCGLKCPGCNNQHLWKREEGKPLYTRQITELCADSDIDGITLHGGEPTEQAEELLPAVKEIKDMGKNVILFTGRKVEQLATPAQRELADISDIVKYGPYIEAEQDLYLHFRGSKNQKVCINPKGALKNYEIQDGTNTVLLTVNEDGSITVNGMPDAEMYKLLEEYTQGNS